jgi:hypothetical protein
MSSVAECKYYSDEQCKILGISEEHWEPFKLLCYEEYNNDGSLTKEIFEERYCGMWYYLGNFAKELMEDTECDSLSELPWYIKQHIDWDKVWDTISVDYDVYESYVFRILH